MIYVTRSIQGRKRDGNYDRAGAAVFGGSRGIFVIADGTSKRGSDQLAEVFVSQVIDRYAEKTGRGAPGETALVAEALLSSILDDTHTDVFTKSVEGSASYLVAICAHGTMSFAYEGDCCAGVVELGSRVEWLTPPHCMANWKRDREHRDLASDLGRHRLTRSFRASRKPDPETMSRPILKGTRVVLATDGFWAELSDGHQAELLADPQSHPPEIDDDLTWIDLHFRS